jgi:hypothetical protein
MKKEQTPKKPDAVKIYEDTRKTIRELETWTNYLADEEIKASQNGDTFRKNKLTHEEYTYQEIINLLYEVTGFIENKFMD